MLQPKRTKFRKEHRGRMNGIRTKGSTLVYGDFGLKAVGPGWVSAREIEAARRAGMSWIDVRSFHQPQRLTERNPQADTGAAQ